MSKTTLMPEVVLEKIGPPKAKLYLEKNKSNRPVSENTVEKYTYDMKRGAWTIDNDTICFSTEGDMLNGQHRMLAVIKSNTTQEFFVARNLPPESFKNMDTAKSRTAADVLAIEGISGANKIAAIAKFIMNFKKSQWSRSVTHHRAMGMNNADISEFVEKNEIAIANCIPYGYRKENKGLVPPAVLSGLFFLFAEKNEAQADDFCDKIVTGANLDTDDPAYVIRQKLIANVRAIKKLSALHKVALICKAWNFYRSGKKVTQYGWDSTKEPFPKPI